MAAFVPALCLIATLMAMEFTRNSPRTGLLPVILSTCRNASWLVSRLGTVAIFDRHLVKQGSEQIPEDFDYSVFGSVCRNADLVSFAKRIFPTLTSWK